MPNLILNSVGNLKNGDIMVDLKWTSYSEVDPKREYYAVIGMGERKVCCLFSLLSCGLAQYKSRRKQQKDSLGTWDE